MILVIDEARGYLEGEWQGDAAKDGKTGSH